jgi:hypothetical protein
MIDRCVVFGKKIEKQPSYLLHLYQRTPEISLAVHEEADIKHFTLCSYSVESQSLLLMIIASTTTTVNKNQLNLGQYSTELFGP